MNGDSSSLHLSLSWTFWCWMKHTDENKKNNRVRSAETNNHPTLHCSLNLMSLNEGKAGSMRRSNNHPTLHCSLNLMSLNEGKAGSMRRSKSYIKCLQSSLMKRDRGCFFDFFSHNNLILRHFQSTNTLLTHKYVGEPVLVLFVALVFQLLCFACKTIVTR